MRPRPLRAETTDQVGDAGHVGVGTGHDERALVAVAVVCDAEVVLRVDDEEVKFGHISFRVGVEMRWG